MTFDVHRCKGPEEMRFNLMKGFSAYWKEHSGELSAGLAARANPLATLIDLRKMVARYFETVGVSASLAASVAAAVTTETISVSPGKGTIGKIEVNFESAASMLLAAADTDPPPASP